MPVDRDRDRLVLGIDPGLDGGLAALYADGEDLTVRPMPVLAGARRELDAAGLATWLYELEAGWGTLALAVVEKVHSMPKQGVASAFSFGISYGAILGVLAALKVPVELVLPQRWKATILTGTAKDKNAAIAFCGRRWPDVNLVPERCRVPHDGIADALCLAEFGRRSLVAADPRATTSRRRRTAC